LAVTVAFVIVLGYQFVGRVLKTMPELVRAERKQLQIRKKPLNNSK